MNLTIEQHYYWAFIFFFYSVPMKAPPKEIPKTIENQRVYDETTVDPADEEVFTKFGRACSNPLRLYLCICINVCFRVQIAFDEGTDEFSAYFNGLTNPKVLITTSDRPRGVSGCCSTKKKRENAFDLTNTSVTMPWVETMVITFNTSK